MVEIMSAIPSLSFGPDFGVWLVRFFWLFLAGIFGFVIWKMTKFNIQVIIYDLSQGNMLVRKEKGKIQQDGAIQSLKLMKEKKEIRPPEQNYYSLTPGLFGLGISKFLTLIKLGAYQYIPVGLNVDGKAMLEPATVDMLHWFARDQERIVNKFEEQNKWKELAPVMMTLGGIGILIFALVFIQYKIGDSISAASSVSDGAAKTQEATAELVGEIKSLLGQGVQVIATGGGG